MRLIDTHSHVGNDRFGTHDGDVREYCARAAEKGVVCAYLIPVPCPRYARGEELHTPSMWMVKDGRVEIVSETERDGVPVRGAVSPNPFAAYNSLMSDGVEEVRRNGENHSIRLEFVPLVHPMLDTIEHLEAVCSAKPPAVKIHGTSWGIDPTVIPSGFFEILRRFDRPLVIHTDYHNAPRTELDQIKRANDPLVWLEVCRRHGLRALLAHGARLCAETLEFVNSSEGFLVGLSPVLDMGGPRVKTTGGEYLDRLLDMVSLDRLVFDIDYPWNRTGDRPDLDWDIDEELKSRLGVDDLDRVCFRNAVRFFDLDFD